MPRRRASEKRIIPPDPVFHSELAQRFINKLMAKGKKHKAENVFYDAMNIIQEKTGKEPLPVFEKAIRNVMPALEVKSRRVGGATYQVPIEVRPERKRALAVNWILGFATSRGGHSMAEKLAGELMDAANNTGASIKKREDTHKMAEANKAYSHYRW